MLQYFFFGLFGISFDQEWIDFKMKTLITGASGFVGSAVLRVLLKKGFQIRSLLRSSSNSENLSGLNVEIVHGDLRDPASLDNALKGCDSLFHVAADYRLWAKNTNEIYQSNVDGTINIMRAAQRQKISKIVYTSSVATLGINRDETPADENTPVTFSDMIGDYKKSKFLAEEKVKKMIQEDSLPATIVNPSAPIGPRDIKPTPTGRMICQAASGKVPAFVDTGLNIVHVDDVAEGHWKAFEKGQIGERYILGGENQTLKQILFSIAEIVEKRPPLFSIPHNLLLPFAYLSEMFARLFNKEDIMLTVDSLRMSKKKMFFSTEKAKNLLDYQPREAIKGIKDAIDWFKENRYF